MWLVTTHGDLPDDYEERERDASPQAWDDYAGRILELEIGGYMRTASLRSSERPQHHGGVSSSTADAEVVTVVGMGDRAVTSTARVNSCADGDAGAGRSGESLLWVRLPDPPGPALSRIGDD